MTKYEQKLLDMVKPDIATRYKKLSKGIFACFPFLLLFGLGAIPMVIIMGKMDRYQKIFKLIEIIQKNDHIKFDFLPAGGCAQVSSLIAIVSKIIEVGLLPDYEIIGEVGVAKKEIHATEQDFDLDTPPLVAATYVTINQNPVTRCPNCGAPITKGKGRFCESCGGKMF